MGPTCLFCYTDCSRVYYFRLPTLKTSLRWFCNCTSCDTVLCNATYRFAKEGTRMRLVRSWLMDHLVPLTENQYYSHMQFLHCVDELGCDVVRTLSGCMTAEFTLVYINYIRSYTVSECTSIFHNMYTLIIHMWQTTFSISSQESSCRLHVAIGT